MVVISQLPMGLLLNSGMQTSKFQARFLFLLLQFQLVWLMIFFFSVFQLWVSKELQHAMHSRVGFLGTKVWE